MDKKVTMFIFFSKSKRKNIQIITSGMAYSSGINFVDFTIKGLLAITYNCSKTEIEIENINFFKAILLSNSQIRAVIPPSITIAKITGSDIRR